MSKLDELYREFERVFEGLRRENPQASEDELIAIFRYAIHQEPNALETAVAAWVEIHGPIRKH
jgi:hypothetical protein